MHLWVILGLLHKDGKLTPAERQCRMDNNLCLICADKGHVAAACPKSRSNPSSSFKPKVARGATTETSTPATTEKSEVKTESTESKK